METDMTDRAQDSIFKQSAWPHSWDGYWRHSCLASELLPSKMRPSSSWQLGRSIFSEKGKCPLGPSLGIKYIYLEKSVSLSTLWESWSCSRIALRGERSCDSQDICLRVGKDCKIKCSSYNRRFNQRNGEGSQSKFLKPKSWVINKYSLVWAEVPSETPTAHSRLQCDAVWPHSSIPLHPTLCSSMRRRWDWAQEGNPASHPEHQGLLPRSVRQMTEGQESNSEAKLSKCLCKIVSSEAQERCATSYWWTPKS